MIPCSTWHSSWWLGTATKAAEDIARGLVWSYWDRSAAPSADDLWAARAFDDSGWASGPGPFGYGESYIRTPVSYGPDPNNKIVTTYFRRWFRVDAPSADTRLLAEPWRNDDAVVHQWPRDRSRALAVGNDRSHHPGVRLRNWQPLRHLRLERVQRVSGPRFPTCSPSRHQQRFTLSDLAFDLALDVSLARLRGLSTSHPRRWRRGRPGAAAACTVIGDRIKVRRIRNEDDLVAPPPISCRPRWRSR